MTIHDERFVFAIFPRNPVLSLSYRHLWLLCWIFSWWSCWLGGFLSLCFNFLTNILVFCFFPFVWLPLLTLCDLPPFWLFNTAYFIWFFSPLFGCWFWFLFFVIFAPNPFGLDKVSLIRLFKGFLYLLDLLSIFRGTFDPWILLLFNSLWCMWLANLHLWRIFN